MSDTERKPTYEELEAEVKELRPLKQLVEQLLLRIDKLERLLYGKKSEKSKEKSKEKTKDKEPKSGNASGENTEPKKERKKNGGGGRKGFPKNIPRQTIRVDLPEEDKRCPVCGTEYEPMGVEVSEVLHLIPALFVVIQCLRHRYKKKCDCSDEKFVIAEMPERPVDKAAVTQEFTASMLVSKYCDHSPIHRQVSRLLKSCGYKVSESSFCRWRDDVGKRLEVFADFIKQKILQSCCISTDATTANFRIPKEGSRLVHGNEYVYIGSNDAPFTYYDFQPNQSHKGVLEFLQGYSGYVQCDAHRNYDTLFSPPVIDSSKPPPLEVGCHAHARRKFKEIEKYEPETVKKFLDIWRKLYQIEKDFKHRSDGERLYVRQKRSVPLLDELFDLCRAETAKIDFLPRSVLGQAVSYALNNEAALRRYCTRGFLNIDNNVSERAVKPFVIGRKNWLFFGSPEAAKWSSVILTVLMSANRHGLNEFEYLLDVLYRLPELSYDEYEQLLPDRWVKSATPVSQWTHILSAAKADGKELFVKTRIANAVDEPAAA